MNDTLINDSHSGKATKFQNFFKKRLKKINLLLLHRLHQQSFGRLIFDTGYHCQLISFITRCNIRPICFIDCLYDRNCIGSGAKACFINDILPFFDIFQISEIIFIIPVMGTKGNIPTHKADSAKCPIAVLIVARSAPSFTGYFLIPIRSIVRYPRISCGN